VFILKNKKTGFNKDYGIMGREDVVYLLFGKDWSLLLPKLKAVW
jgi:hypothetical protein